MESMHKIHIKRVYEALSETDGVRILTDRLWPRGIKRETARINDWWKDTAPSTELRKWFGHDPERFEEFAEKYRKELQNSAKFPEQVRQVRELLGKSPVTLLYGARDTKHNHAVVLRLVLEERLSDF